MSKFLLSAKLYAGHSQVAKFCAWRSYKLLYTVIIGFVIAKYHDCEKN